MNPILSPLSPLSSPIIIEDAKPWSHSDFKLKLQHAFNSGILKPFEKKLKHIEIQEPYSFWDRLLVAASQKEGAPFYSAREFEPIEKIAIQCFLIAIDPAKDIRAKKECVHALVNAFNESGKTSFFYGCMNSLPKIIGANILCLTNDIKHDTMNYLMEFRDHNNWTAHICKIAREIPYCKFPIEYQHEVLKKILSKLDSEDQNECFAYIRLNFSGEETKDFLALCPEDISKGMDSFNKALESSYEKILKSIDESSKYIYLPSERYTRAYILELFFTRLGNDDRRFVRIVQELSEREWEWLYKEKLNPSFERTKIVALKILNWIQLSIEQDAKISSRCRSFYRDACINISKDFGTNRWKDLENDIDKLIKSVSTRILAVYFDSFNEDFWFQVFKSLSSKGPLFLSFINDLVNAPEKKEYEIKFNLNMFFNRLKDANVFSSGISIVNSAKPIEWMPIYSFTPQNTREELLKALVKEPKGLIKLCEFICFAEFETEKLKFGTYIRNEFFQNLHSFLIKISPDLPDQILKILAEFSSKCEHAIALLSEKTIDPKVKQQYALKKLNEYFSSQDLNSRSLTELVNQLNDDLKAGEPEAIWVKRIFDHLEPAKWPLIFEHFSISISHHGCFPYIQRPFDQREQPKYTWLDDLEWWVNTASKTLEQIFDNPWIQKYHGNIVGYVCVALENSHTAEKVLLHFFKTASPLNIIRILGEIYRFHFHSNNSDFDKFLAPIIEKLGEQKLDFITELLKTSLQKGRSISYEASELRSRLLRPPYCNSQSEPNKIINKIIDSSPDGLLNFSVIFYHLGFETQSHVVKTLQNNKAVDYTIFLNNIIFDLYVNRKIANESKINIISSFFYVSDRLGVDIIKIPFSPELESLHKHIADSYVENLKGKKTAYNTLKIHMKIINHHYPKEFNSIILNWLQGFPSINVSFIASVAKYLHELQLLDPFLKELISSKSPLIEVLKRDLQKELNVNEHPLSYIEFPLLTTLTQLSINWEKSILKLVKEEIQKEQYDVKRYGKKESDYKEIKEIVKSLKVSRYLEHWHKYAASEADPQTLEIIERILKDSKI
jgi:hypothetical protein